MNLSFTDCVDIVGSAVPAFEGTKKYISTGALEDDHIDFSQVENVTYANKPSRANLACLQGDIVFAKMQGTRKTLLLNQESAEYIYSTGFCAVRAKESIITKRCLYHLITSDYFLSQKDKYCSGSTQKAITNSGLQKIMISVPKMEKQNALSDYFDKIDDSIHLCYAILKKLDLLVKSRFIELFGDIEQNPFNWNKFPIGDYITLLTDFSANGSYEYLDSNIVMYNEPNYALMIRTTDLEKNDFENDVKYIDEKAYNILSKSKVYGNEIIMNKIGSAGKVYLMPVLNRPVSLGRNAFMFRFNSDINIIFLYHLLISAYGTKEIQQYVRGAVTKTITKDAVRSIRIIVPPIELQTQFVEFVQSVDKSKLAVKQVLEKAETLKKSLMQEYFAY